MPGVPEIIREMARVLQPDGRLVGAIPLRLGLRVHHPGAAPLPDGRFGGGEDVPTWGCSDPSAKPWRGPTSKAMKDGRGNGGRLTRCRVCGSGTWTGPGRPSSMPP
jgi:hypothetical protein